MSNTYLEELVLTQGPSRENLFDALRLGGVRPELGIVEFAAKNKKKSEQSDFQLLVAIEGLQRNTDDGKEWWFWGRLSPTLFVCGGWNTYKQRGFVRTSTNPFWISPFGEGSLNNKHSEPHRFDTEPPTKY